MRIRRMQFNITVRARMRAREYTRYVRVYMVRAGSSFCIPPTRPHSFTLMHHNLRCICRGAQRNAVRRMCGLSFIPVWTHVRTYVRMCARVDGPAPRVQGVRIVAPAIPREELSGFFFFRSTLPAFCRRFRCCRCFAAANARILPGRRVGPIDACEQTSKAK